MPPPDDLPVAVATLVGDGRWEPTDRRAGAPASDHRVVGADGRTYEVAVARTAEAAERLTAEVAKLRWVGAHLPVPQVVAFEHDVDDATAWLVTSPLAGEPGSAVHHRVDGRGLARAFAAGLRAVHDLDVASCPFDAGLEARTGIVVERIEQGAVVSAQLSEAYRRHEPDRLLALWRGARPPDEDLVVTHGRYTLDGVSIAHGEVAGYRDWYRCGVADRYVDLAVAAGSLAAAVGPELVVEFFDAYGIEHPSLAKIDFYALGAELLG